MPESREPTIEYAVPTPIDRGTPDLRRQVRVLAEDTRNVLVVVRAYSELLEERYGDASFRAELQALLWEGAARVDQMLSELESMAASAGERGGAGRGQD